MLFIKLSDYFRQNFLVRKKIMSFAFICGTCWNDKLLSLKQMNLNLQNSVPLGSNKKRKFGAVFLMEDSETNKQYILKTANRGQISERALQQLKNEYTFSFNHPGLPKVIGFDETNETTSLLLAYKKGITLTDYWETVQKKKRLDFTKQLVVKISVLLDEIHSQQIYHCDIKPSNILIERTGTDFNVHLIDFGMAVNKNNLDYLNRKLIFPLGFAAPELILNRIDLINKTTDYFALGITIYRLWAGKLPLVHANPSIFTNLQLAYQIPSDSAMPKTLNEWIQNVCYKPHWKTAPNLMTENEVTHTLLDSFERRYIDSHKLIEGIEKVRKRKWFW